jgi:hypothetical protein
VAELLDRLRAGERRLATAALDAWADVRPDATADGCPARWAADVGRSVDLAPGGPEPVSEFPRKLRAAELPDAVAPCKQDADQSAARSCAASEVAAARVERAASRQRAELARSEYLALESWGRSALQARKSPAALPLARSVEQQGRAAAQVSALALQPQAAGPEEQADAAAER